MRGAIVLGEDSADLRAVRFLLSVAVSTMIATPPARNLRKQSHRIVRRPYLARATFDCALDIIVGMLCARAAWIALRRRGLPLGSPPPALPRW